MPRLWRIMVDVDAELYERLVACEEQYTLHFAEQVRLTRDPGMLTSLIAQVRDVGTQASQRGYAQLVGLADQQAKHYEVELGLIDAALAEAGPRGQAVARLTRRASLLMHCYTRHFAGQARPSRDVGLLHEMVHGLRQLHEALAPLETRQAGIIADFAQQWEAELSHIERSRAQGDVRAQAANYAGAANTLLHAYTTCCLQRRRLAVRPGLLGRLAGELQRLVGALEALSRQGLDMAHHHTSVEALHKQLGVWHAEHQQAMTAQRRASLEERVAALTAELDDVFGDINRLAEAKQFAGKGVGPLCDRTSELEMQLRSLCDSSAAAVENQELVTAQLVASDTLCMLCQRYDAP